MLYNQATRVYKIGFFSRIPGGEAHLKLIVMKALSQQLIHPHDPSRHIDDIVMLMGHEINGYRILQEKNRRMWHVSRLLAKLNSITINLRNEIQDGRSIEASLQKPEMTQFGRDAIIARVFSPK
jgi:hypothetical protein